jgi:hypothetical protein
MTFSLLLDKEVFAKFIEQNKTNNIGKSLITKYERYWKRKEDLYKMRNEYDELYKKIISKKHEYDLKTVVIYNTLSVIIPGTGLNPAEKKTLGEASEDMHDLYVEFIDLLVDLANVLYNFYLIQIDYFNYIVDFLKEFKKEYVHIINYYKDTADIANMCIDEDIRIYELLSVESAVTNLNVDSQAYFANIKNLKEKLYKLKKEQSILSDINIQETLQKYKDDPYLLILLRKQYNIYYLFFKTSFHTNQYYTWKIYYKGTDALVTKMNIYFFEKIQQTIDFGPTVTEKKLTIPTPTIKFIKELQDKLKPYNFTGIKENKDVIKSFAQKWFTRPSSEPKPEVQWKLVNDQDLPVIKDSDKELTKDEKNYIEFIKYEVNLFDCITMIINLLHIKCLRQFRLYVAEENETNYDLFILKNKFFYYLALKGFVNILNIPILDFDNIETEFNFYAGQRRNPSISPNFKIPYSCFWDTSKLNDDYFYLSKLDVIGKLLLIQNYKIREIRNTKTFYERDCNKFENMLLSRISQNGIENICKSLFINFNYFINSKQFISLASISETDSTLKSIDLKNTVEFNNYIIILFVDRGIIPANESFLADQRWIIYNNNYQLKEYKTIFLPGSVVTADQATKYVADNFLNNFLKAVSDVLNKQLDLLNAVTINLYTDDVNIDGTIKKRFTIDSLKRLINDFEDDPNVIQNLQNGIILGRLYKQNNPGINDQIPNINTKRMLFSYYEKYIIFILKQFLDINIYIFYMFSINFIDPFRLDTRVKLNSNKNTPHADKIYIITKIIKQDGQKPKYKLIEEPVAVPAVPPAPALNPTYIAEELEFSDLGQADSQKWDEPFEIICNDQNHLTDNYDNIIFLLRTTNEYFDYNYEMISTYTEQCIFNSADMPIRRYISPLYVNICLSHIDVPVPVIFDASSRGSSSSSDSSSSSSSSSDSTNISDPSGSDLRRAHLGFYFSDPGPCSDDSSDSKSCDIARRQVDYSDDFISLDKSYQKYLEETEEGSIKPRRSEADQDKALIDQIIKNIKETNTQYDTLVDTFNEIYHRKQNINISVFLNEVNYIKDVKYPSLKTKLSHFTDKSGILDLIDDIDIRLENLNFFEKHTLEYMRLCDIDNARIEELIQFFSDKERYYNSSYEEIQEFVGLYEYLMKKFLDPKTNIEEYFKNRMSEFSEEPATKNILKKMQDYINYIITNQDGLDIYPYFGDYLESLKSALLTKDESSDTDDSSISGLTTISYSYMPELNQDSDDIKEIYNTFKRGIASAPEFDPTLINYSPEFLEIYARYNAFVRYLYNYLNQIRRTNLFLNSTDEIKCFDKFYKGLIELFNEALFITILSQIQQPLNDEIQIFIRQKQDNISTKNLLATLNCDKIFSRDPSNMFMMKIITEYEELMIILNTYVKNILPATATATGPLAIPESRSNENPTVVSEVVSEVDSNAPTVDRGKSSQEVGQIPLQDLGSISETASVDASGYQGEFESVSDDKPDDGSDDGSKSNAETVISDLTQGGGDGRARDKYYEYAKNVQNPYQPQMPLQAPMPYQQQMPLQAPMPYQPQMLLQAPMPYQMTGPVPYPPLAGQMYPYQNNMDFYTQNLQYNFLKENKSKLSYYITVDLELYPGTKVSGIKKYSLKCQSTFERIRKSLADLFGYQYRPLEIKEAYEYEANFEANEKIKEETEKKLEEDKKEKEREEKYRERERERDERERERDERDRERDRERNRERNRERERDSRERRGGKLNKSLKTKKRSKNKTLKKIK